MAAPNNFYTRPEWANDAYIERIKSQLSTKHLTRVGSGLINRFGSSGAHSNAPYVEPVD